MDITFYTLNQHIITTLSLKPGIKVTKHYLKSYLKVVNLS